MFRTSSDFFVDLSFKVIKGWDERINYEIELLRKVAKGIKIPYEL